MYKISLKVLLLAALVGFSASCKKDDKDEPKPSEEPNRTTPYNTSTSITFANSQGDSTVDRTEGRIRLAMLKELDAYAKKGTTLALNPNVLKNMFSNTGDSFASTTLNGSGLNIKEKTASSVSYASTIQGQLETYFTELETASTSYATAATKGQAGTLSYMRTDNTTTPPKTTEVKYLVDAKGIELAQVISKSLIGAFQLDYIGNILLANTEADNKVLVTGKKYSQLEHNWDEAYGLFTVNDIYCFNATDVVRTPGESFLGSYVWEYNKGAYPKLHEAFLKGRTAIVNNNKAELKVQADYIRTEMEMAIARAAAGYMAKASDASKTTAERAHAFAEGLGFIYSLQFCTLHGADATFSAGVIAGLFPTSSATFYDITATQYTAASNAIKTKFGF